MDARAVFIDTNALVYASVVESPFCQRVRGLLKRLEAGASELWVSRQIMREFLAQRTRAAARVREPRSRRGAVGLRAPLLRRCLPLTAMGSFQPLFKLSSTVAAGGLHSGWQIESIAIQGMP